ncbi:MAG: hypothetical protein ACRDU8_01960, partial [Egibacteraceae bacterium]
MERKLVSAVAAMCLFFVAACAGANTAPGEAGGETDAGGEQAGGDYPSETLNWTIAFGPGGGNDIMSRTIIEILQAENLYPADIVAENLEGGSGARGWGHLRNQAGDPYQVSTTSGSYITTPLQADAGFEPTDFTP